MKLILKGLTDKKLLFRNCLIIFILLLGYSAITLLLRYQENLVKEEFKKADYRTLYFKSKTEDYSYLKEYEIEAADILEDGKFMVIFLTYEERNRFMEECQYAQEIGTQSVQVSNTENNSIIFKIISVIIIFTIFTLVFIFTLNYLLSIQKDLSLYKIMGFQKNRVLMLLGIIYGLIYSSLFFIAYNATYFSYFLLSYVGTIQTYYNIYQIDYRLLITLIIILIISILLSSKEDKRISDLDKLKIN